MNNVLDLFKFPKFKLKRLPTRRGEEPLGCGNCGGFTFVVITKDGEGATLRCTCCHTDIKSMALIHVGNHSETDEPKVA